MSDPTDSANRKPVVMLAALAAVVIILITAAVLTAPGRAGRGLADEGTRPALLTLTGYVLAKEPAPHIVRALKTNGQLGPGELLTLRARISSPAYLSLIAQRPGNAAEPIWPATAELRAAGELELTEGDKPLTLDARLAGPGTAIVLVACPNPLPDNEARTHAALANLETAQGAFPRCVVAPLK